MNSARRWHAAGIVTDQGTKEKLIVASGGDIYGIKLDTTEIFYGDKWNQGNVRDEWIALFSDIRILGYHGYLNIMDTCYLDNWIPWILGYHGYMDTMDTKFLHYPDNG